MLSFSIEKYSDIIQKQTINYLLNFIFEKKDVETGNMLMNLILEEWLKMNLNDIDLSPNYLKALFVYQWNLTSDTKSDFDFISETRSVEMIEDLKGMDKNSDDESDGDDFLLL